MKKRVPKGWVKISDFEQLVGVSTKTVMSAIKRGYIPSEIADVVGTSATAPYYLDPKKAAVSWYHSLNSGHPNQRKVRTALGAYIRTFDAAVVGFVKAGEQQPDQRLETTENLPVRRTCHQSGEFAKPFRINSRLPAEKFAAEHLDVPVAPPVEPADNGVPQRLLPADPR